MAVAVALTILATTTSARAQAAITDPTPIADPAPSPFIVDFTGEEANVAGQGAVRPDSTTFAAEGRACDGCPRRSVGRAFFDTTIINVFYGVANLARGQVTARVTPKSWWVNMEQGWVWDLDNFVVNQVGHPYQGNNYFNAGRANGLSFWESAGITAFGSGTWEYFGETNHASLNDLVNTTLGGIALGEMFHRAAWLVRDTRATGTWPDVEGNRRHCHRSRDWRQAVPDGRLLSRVGEAGRDGTVRACRRGLGGRAVARLQHQRLRLSGEAILRG